MEVVAPEVEIVEIDSLTLHPRNPMEHPDSQIVKLVHSIQEFGFTSPVLVDADDRVLAGHGRIEALQRIGTDVVPIIRLPLSGPHADAYLIADNRIARDAVVDTDVLVHLLTDLRDAEVDLTSTGYEEQELKRLLDAEDTSPQLATDLVYRVIVECSDETEQQAVMAHNANQGYRCTPIIL